MKDSLTLEEAEEMMSKLRARLNENADISPDTHEEKLDIINQMIDVLAKTAITNMDS